MIEVKISETSSLRHGQVETLTNLINSVYSISENGLWVSEDEGFPGRTSVHEIEDFWRAGQLAIAWQENQIVGCVHLTLIDARRAEFGMLVTHPEFRRQGLGASLIDYAEKWALNRGREIMQLELLTPKNWTHPVKRMLHDWYQRIGYQPAKSMSLSDTFPHLAPFLATPCNFTSYEKKLDA